MPALTARNLTKTFVSRRLFSGISLSVEEGERLALIGPNGSGKSTLLKILAQIDDADEGDITRRKNLRVAYVAQADTFEVGLTVLSAVTAAAQSANLPHVHDHHEAELAAMLVLGRIELPDLNAPASGLSGGQKKRLAIACALVQEPHVLLLDEPTNHLDVEGIEWLQSLLTSTDCATVFVTHDRIFLEESATRIVELSPAYPDGTLSVAGNYSEFLRRKADFLEGQARQQQALAGLVREDIRWLGRGAQARRTKSKSRAATAYDRIDELAELKTRNAPDRATTIEFSATDRLTTRLLWARGLRKGFGDRLLFTGLDVLLSPGVKVALMGPNGCGKSTLINILTGALSPDAPTDRELDDDAEHAGTLPHGAPALGTIRKADNLRIVLFSQHRTELDPEQTLASALSPVDAVNYRGRTQHIVGWAARFLFNRDQLQGPIRSLSGGEKARVHIARLMLEPADVLILDEPTNDLDIPSLEVLEESLEDFPGAVVLVSHDRAMVERLATDILALDGRGGVRSFADYSQWEAFIHESGKAKPTERAAGSAGAGATAAAVVESGPAKKKLSYKEQQELSQIEPAIHKAEADVTRLEASMNDPKVIASHREYAEVCHALSESQAKVSALFDRWAELDGKR